MNNLQRNLREEQLKSDFLIAFQPVYSRNMNVAALKLLLESDSGSQPTDTYVGNVSQLVLDTYGSLCQFGQVTTVPVHLEVPDNLLANPDSADLPAKQFILYISARQRPTLATLNSLRSLANQGYRLALTDYPGNEENANPLLDIVHMAILDVSGWDLPALKGRFDKLRALGVDIQVDGLTSQQQFRTCFDLGCHYFSGQFQEKPLNSSGRSLGSDKLLLLELLTELQKPNTSIGALEAIAIKDANLTYRLLKIINSAAFGASRQIDTLAHAINLLGINQLSRWITLFLIEGNQDQNRDLMRTMLIRGRMCEILAELLDREKITGHFIAGLLSQLDLMTGMSMAELMDKVPLSSDIKGALLFGEGSMGELLREVEHYEQGHFNRLKNLVEREFYEVAYRHSTAWAKQILSAMAN